jgi:hypothetical protein
MIRTGLLQFGLFLAVAAASILLLAILLGAPVLTFYAAQCAARKAIDWTGFLLIALPLAWPPFAIGYGIAWVAVGIAVRRALAEKRLARLIRKYLLISLALTVLAWALGSLAASPGSCELSIVR